MSVAQLCLTLCDPMDCSQRPLSMDFSRQEYWSGFPFPSSGDLPRDQTWVACIAGRFFTIWATREALVKTFWKLASNYQIIGEGMASHSNILAWVFHGQRLSTIHGVTKESDMTEQLTQHPVHLGLIKLESCFSLPLRPLDFGLPQVCVSSKCITPVQWCCLLLPLGKSFISSQEFLPALLLLLIKLFFSIWRWDACRSKACSISLIAVDVWNTIVP